MKKYIDLLIPDKLKAEGDIHRRTRLLVASSAMVIVFCLSHSPVYYSIEYWAGLGVFAYGAISAGVVLYGIRKKPDLFFWGTFFNITSLVFFLIMTLTSGGIYSPMVIWFTMLPVTAFLLLSKKQVRIWLIITALVLVLLFSASFFSLKLIVGYASEVDNIVTFASIGGIVVYISYAMFVYEKGMQEKINGIKAAEMKAKAEKNKAKESAVKVRTVLQEVTNSVRYAGRIQSAVLGEKETAADFLKDAFILYQNRDIVSGDFYWSAGVTADDGRKYTVLAAADCTGHGVPGAFLTILGKTFLDEIISGKKIVQPDKVLNLLDEKVRAATGKRRLKSKSFTEGMDIALITIDEERHKLWFAGAKRPLYYVRKSNFTPESRSVKSVIHVIKGTKVSIGSANLLKSRTGFECHELDYERDDKFYIFSDGYADQFGGENNKKFMIKNFRSLLVTVSYLPMRDQMEKLKSELRKWQGYNEQTDDILVIGFSPKWIEVKPEEAKPASLEITEQSLPSPDENSVSDSENKPEPSVETP